MSPPDVEIQQLCDPLVVPANASRYLPETAARAQSTGTVTLAWDRNDPYIFNRTFSPGLIAHDEAYYTTVVDMKGVVQVPTLEFISDVLRHVGSDPMVIDIGCGQGEFVTRLHRLGIRAVGYDPVARQAHPWLRSRYWRPGDEGGDLLVMRCVLPHIQHPWDFVDEIGRRHPDALLLVEFQRLDWILEHDIWYQLSHDHVNVFTQEDFASRYTMVDSGTFRRGEWAWVLIKPGGERRRPEGECRHQDQLRALMLSRSRTLAAAAICDRPLAIWGAAGKGTVLAHSLTHAGASVVAAVDADPGRQGLHLEVSGVRVVSPQEAFHQFPGDTLILVSNPNHLAAVADGVGDRWDVTLPSVVFG